MKFAKEKLSEILPEMLPLLESNHEEITGPRYQIPLEPNFELYLKLAELNIIHVFTVRENTELLGYALFFVQAPLHYKNKLWALADIIYLHPKARGKFTAIKLLRFCEIELQKLKVFAIHTTGSVEHPALARVLEFLGHTRIEYGYTKILPQG
jgi:hypothetical protein